MTLWWEGSDDMAGTWWQRIGQGEAEWKKPLKFPSWVTLGWRAFVWARESMGRAAPLVWESVKECILHCLFFFPSAYGLSPCKTGMIRETAIPFSSPCPAATLCVLRIKMAWNLEKGPRLPGSPCPPGTHSLLSCFLHSCPMAAGKLLVDKRTSKKWMTIPYFTSSV